MYKQNKIRKTTIGGVKVFEGDTIERRVERMLNNKEPLEGGAPLLYTERKDGVMAGYDIRTDRWDLAYEAGDKIQASIQAKRDAKAAEMTPKVVDMNGNNTETGGQSTDGTN